MDINRRFELECTEATMTPEEIASGYHFCSEFDGMVVGPGDPEWSLCTCNTHRPKCGAGRDE